MKKFDYDLIDELITKYVYVSLNDDNHYVSNISIGNTQMKLTCGYNSINKQRWIKLQNEGGNVLLPQTFLKYGRRCELNFNAELNDLSYYVTLSPKDLTKVRFFTNDYDYANWSKDFRICFVGMSNSLVERLKVNGYVYMTNG